MSALSSATKLNKLEPHSASRLCLSRRLAERFTHMVDAPMDMRSSLPLGPDHESSTLVLNHAIHEEQPPHEEEPEHEQPAVVTCPAVLVHNEVSVSDGSAGVSTTTSKKKSKPFRRVAHK